jgi:23S rRNA (uracil1939-C5)-methyltransferase
MATDSQFEVRIEKLVYGGDGLAHHDGQTVFVPLVLGGERARVVAVERKKKFVRARVEEILEPGAERVAAPCPRFGVCGGCQYQHMSYAAQLASKAQILRETLGRIGRIEWTGEIPTHASPPLGYRNRAQWAVRPASEGGRPAIGYFELASSMLAPTDVCPILAPKLQSVLAALAGACERGELPGSIRAIEAFTDAGEQNLLINVGIEKAGNAPAEKMRARLGEVVGEITSLLVQDEKSGALDLSGPGHIFYEAAGFTYRVGHLSFFQVNRNLIDELARDVTGDGAGELALDLFAGVGLFSAALAARYKRVIAVEGNVAAARDLETNLKEMPAARARHSEVEAFLARWNETPDLVVLDPPRAGISEASAKRLRALGPEKIQYLSCDPATLARDLAILTRPSGEALDGVSYRISKLQLYDIFPQTYHIEALASLERLG